MKKNILFLAMLLITAINTKAQEDNALMKDKLKITDAYIFPGMLFQGGRVGILSDFQKMAPKSTLLNQSFADYTSNSKPVYSGDIFFSAAVGICGFNKEKNNYHTNPQIKLGVMYFSENSLTNNYSKTERTPYDTLTSSVTGQTYYYDFVRQKNLNMSYATQQIRLDASVIYRTNPDARWSIYGGIGLEIGSSINATTTISYNETAYVESASQSANSFPMNQPQGTTTSIYERFYNKNNIGAAAYIPMGLDFRLGKKREFFKRLHIFGEARPGINYTTIKEAGLALTTTNIKAGWGMRVNF